MSGTRRAIAVVIAMIGAIWVGQGVGVIDGSFMTSDLRWAAAGIALIAIAGALVWSSRRSSNR